MSKTYETKVLIIGSGAAGCTAAIYAARAGLEPIMVKGNQPGGQLTITTDVENYPGFANGIQGPELMQAMEDQARNVGATIIDDNINEVDFASQPFTCVGDSGQIYIGTTVIIATGASARWLGAKGEEKFQNFGVSACATCDGFFYKDKEVAVIGGGNSAVEEALYLANIASKVTLIHRRDSLRAEKILQDRLFNNDKIDIIWDSEVEEFVGEDNPPSLTGIKIKNVKTGDVTTINVHGAFVAIGHKPNSDLFKEQLDLDEYGYVLTKKGCTSTSISGIFAAGDIQDRIYRQAITAAGTGCMAALDAERFLGKMNG